MYSSFLEDFIINENSTIMEAYWKYGHNKKILIVVDDNNEFKGVITKNEIDGYNTPNPNNLVSSIVNKNCKSVQYNDNQEFMYGCLRNIFADNIKIQCIPVLKGHDIVDLYSRNRAFWAQSFQDKKLHYYPYAKGLSTAVQTAKYIGYKRISTIEFGVAGGNGLKMLEIHAMELSRLYNIEIEVYGFDTGNGLPNNKEDYRNRCYMWREGNYEMNVAKLKSQLRNAKLILGDLTETLPVFLNEFNPAPVGFISIDVDLYSSTLPILDFVTNLSDKDCLPRMNVYFDDIEKDSEFTGEDLAIKEFNQSHTNYKISSESSTENLKVLHKFNHSLYNYHNGSLAQLPLNSSIHI